MYGVYLSPLDRSTTIYNINFIHSFYIRRKMLLLCKYKMRLLLRCINHFKTDLFNNMDHMRISGTELSSVIISQTT